MAACAADLDWEAGGAIGYGAYHNGSIFSPDGRAAAGVGNRFAAGAVLCQELYDHLGGEIRYTYQDGDFFVTANGQKALIQGHSHAVHYDFLFHFRAHDERVRPFIAAGGGVKVYSANSLPTGTAGVQSIATLAERHQHMPMLSIGVGVKVKLSPSVLVRADFRAYVTAFPDRVIVPAAGGGARGILHQFTPMVGVSYVF